MANNASPVRNALDVVLETSKLIQYSPKRTIIFQQCSDSGAVNGCLRVISGSEFKFNIAVCVQGSYEEVLVSTNQIAVLYDVKVANPPQFPISIIFYL